MSSEWNERIDRLMEELNKHKNVYKEDKDIKK